MADLLYNDQASTDRAVRLLILSIMVVFDPLAILLVVAANIQLERIQMNGNSKMDMSFDHDNWFTMVEDPSKTTQDINRL